MAMAAAAASLTGIMAGSASYWEKSMPASDDPIIKFLLTIEKGKPSGSYPVGSLVTVVADAAPAGAQFAGWTGDVAILANPFLPETSATIPYMAVTITATYTAPVATYTAPVATYTAPVATYTAPVANERLDDLRQELAREAQDHEAIKGLRWLLLHGHDNLEICLLKEELAELWQQRDGPNATAILARMLRQGKSQRHSATPSDQR